MRSPAVRLLCPAAVTRTVVEGLDVPYYEQTSEFTCGPACVLMTVAALDRDPFELSRMAEFEVWRRTTLIGAGGTDAFGLALPFLDRGFEVKILNEKTPTIPRELLQSFLTEEDAKLAQWSSKEARREVETKGATIEERAPKVADVEQALEEGWVPNCLVGMQEVHEEEVPHWVVAYEVDAEGVRFHDPYPPAGREGLHVPRERFQKMLDDITELGASRGLVLVRKPRGRGAPAGEAQARREEGHSLVEHTGDRSEPA